MIIHGILANKLRLRRTIYEFDFTPDEGCGDFVAPYGGEVQTGEVWFGEKGEDGVQ